MMLSPSEAWPVVQEAILVFRANVPDMAKARQALTNVLSTKAWRSYDSPTGAKCSYDDFTAWVKAPVPLGLHTTVPNLLEIAKGNKGLEDLLDQALQNPAYIHTDVNNINVSRPQGTSRAQALRKLRAEADRGNAEAAELHADVLADRISAHAAMVRAGFRPHTFTVRADDPERTARTLRKHFKDPEQLKLLIKHLKED